MARTPTATQLHAHAVKSSQKRAERDISRACLGYATWDAHTSAISCYSDAAAAEGLEFSCGESTRGPLAFLDSSHAATLTLGTMGLMVWLLGCHLRASKQCLFMLMQHVF